MSIRELALALEHRLAVFYAEGDPDVLWEPESQREADALYHRIDWYAPESGVADGARMFNAAYLLASFHWHRCEYIRDEIRREDAGRATFLYKTVYMLAPHLVPEVVTRVYVESDDPVLGLVSEQPLSAFTQSGVNLLKRAEATGDTELLDDAAELCLLAARASPRDDVVKAEALITLGNVLTRRYEFTAEEDDLERAFLMTRAAEEMVPDDGPCRLKYCSGLGHILIREFQRTGDLDILGEAIRALREGVAAGAEDDPLRAAVLTNLTTALTAQYQAVGRLDSANEALRVQFEAAASTPRDHPDLPSRLVNLAGLILGHPGEVAARADRYELAIGMLDDALSLLPEGHPDRPGCLHTLTQAYEARYELTEDPGDLAAAAEAGVGAVESSAVGHYRRPMMLRGFAHSLKAVVDHFPGSRKLLDTALAALHEADALLPENHPDRTGLLTELGLMLRDRHRTGGAAADRKGAVKALRRAAAVPTAPAKERARAAALAGDVLAEAGRFAKAVDCFALALEQLELTAWRGLERADRERLIATFPSLAANAATCAIRAGDPERAVELLEQGRGILLAQALETRTDHGRLRARAPKLVDRLDEVLDELERLPDSPAGTAGWERPDHLRAHERRVALAGRRERLLQEIRALDGFGGFLRPPSFETLRAAAAEGPVVLPVVSTYGCSVLLLTTDGARALALETDAEDLSRRAVSLALALDPGYSPIRARKTVKDTLGWLWDVVAAPVLAALGHTAPIGPDGDGPRLWWCPTGIFTQFPLHAAGRPSAGGGEGVADRVVSSYTPTLRALLHARTRLRLPAGPEGPGLVVSLPVTPDFRDLPAAEAEAAALCRRHPEARLLTGPAATAPAVLAELARCAWAHFACHGTQDLAMPSRGALVLHDGPLTLRDIVNLRLPRARFAYLSACETSRGGFVLADEAISFAAALQLAGFRDVVGTLWSIDDGLAPVVAEAVYGELSRPEAPGPAVALHRALRAVRALRPRAVAAWAAYVHVGP
ncbi:CHAT domain-containing protein [Streptomyces sp. NPDC048659]|uniref:CHAT domain-containing protein n=1 Tax=Streptomyces sp. NPDC048659 TaxID=3155489 RepID=UPI00341C91E2